MSTHLLERLRAETLLRGQLILEQVTQLKDGMTYKTDEATYSLTDFFELIRKEASKLSQVQLSSAIAPGNEQMYLVNLLTSYETVLDEVERQIVRAIFFAGKLKSLRSRVDNLSSTFVAWYLIALSDQVKDVPSLKLTSPIQKSLAESEFSRLLDGADQDLEGMLEATSILVDMLKGHKKLAAEKYNMGKDQVNASLSSMNTDGYLAKGAPAFVRKPDPIEDDDDEPVRFRPKSETSEVTEGVRVATRDISAEEVDGVASMVMTMEAEAAQELDDPCVPSGVKILMGDDKSKPVEDLEPGDAVAGLEDDWEAAPRTGTPSHEIEAFEDEDVTAPEPKPASNGKKSVDDFEDEDVTGGSSDDDDTAQTASIEDDDDVTVPHKPKALDPKPTTIVGEVDVKDLAKAKLPRPADDDDEDVVVPPKKEKKSEVVAEPAKPRTQEKVPALFTPRRPAPTKSFTDDEDLEGVM
jgi:hypothetical protein